jgi:hypothetical protein
MKVQFPLKYIENPASSWRNWSFLVNLEYMVAQQPDSNYIR